MIKQFEETLFDAHRQVLTVEEVYFENKSEYQHIIIFHNSKFGRVMALDGVVQTTERDEFIYHEMLTHVPIFTHGAVESVLIIGGGDGGMLREVLRHKGISAVTMVEIDQAVIDMCRQYLPNHSQGAFDDSRLNLVIADGAEFVKKCGNKFDIIIVDSTDPIGSGEVLFTQNFYNDCKKLMTENSIIVTQNGVAFTQAYEIKNTAKYFSSIFKLHHFYTASIPTYIGGLMTFGWGTDNIESLNIPIETLRKRYISENFATQYYNPEIHKASFVLPQFILNIIDKTKQ